MTDKTREAIAEAVRYYRNAPYPAPNDALNLCLKRIEAAITAQADGVTDEEIRAEAVRRAENETMRTVYLRAFTDCGEWLRSKLTTPKPSRP